MSGVDVFTFRSPHEVYFGAGELKRLGEVSRRLGSHALIATGGGSARRLGYVDRAQESLEAAGIASSVHEGISPEPPLEDVECGRAAARECGADFVVALGGGSVLDVGKAIAGLGLTDASVREYHSGGLPCDAPGLPCVAIPTTSGTGSEATPNSVLTDPDRGVKTSIRGAALMPEVAIIDPELTLDLPPEPTAHSGLDALCQAIEAYVSNAANPMSDALAERAVQAMAPALGPVVSDGPDIAHRTAMALGSHLAGLALASARLGLVHGLAHAVGLATGKPHGLVCGAMLPMVIRANADHAEAKYAWLAEVCYAGASAEDLARWVEQLCSDLGVPTRLSELGVEEAQLGPIAEVGASAGSTKFNPRTMSAEAILDLMCRTL